MAKKPANILYFFMVATGVFLSTMDSSMINIALPFIMKSFSATLAHAEWVVLIYLLTITVSLLLVGQLSDRIGKGVLYLLGMLVFTVGCCLCYASSSLSFLIFSRFVQGIGAAMMMSTGPAIIRLVVPHEQLGSWLGSLGVATSFGLMSGPLFGGFIIHNYSWRMMFLLTVPVSFAVFVAGWIFLAGTLPRHITKKKRFDWLGSVLWALLMLFTVIFLNGIGHQSLGMTISVPLIFIILLYFFIIQELKEVDPFIPVVLLRQKYYGIAMLTLSLSFAVLFFVLILMPFYLSYISGYSSDKIGYVMMALPVSLFIVSPLSGRVFDLIGAKYLTSAGLLITGTAIILLTFITQDSSALDISWRLALIGCGQSIFLSPNSASVLSRVSLGETGTSAGMLATCRNFGMLLGVALAGLIFRVFFSIFSDGQNLKNYSESMMEPFMDSFRISLGLAAILAFLGALISLKRGS